MVIIIISNNIMMMIMMVAVMTTTMIIMIIKIYNNTPDQEISDSGSWVAFSLHCIPPLLFHPNFTRDMLFPICILLLVF